jgi:hypothetical protein
MVVLFRLANPSHMSSVLLSRPAISGLSIRQVVPRITGLRMIGGRAPISVAWMSADMDHLPKHSDDDHGTAIKCGLLVMLFVLLALSALDVLAAQPTPEATESEHLYFLGHLLVVAFSFFFAILGAAHGYATGAPNSGHGG